MAKTQSSADRDVLFRLGVAPHPQTKKTIEELNRQVKSVDKSIAASAQNAAMDRTRAAQQAAKAQIDSFAKAKKAHEDFSRKSRELNEKFVTDSEGAAQAVLQLGRGIATLGLTGEESTEKILRGLVAIQGGFDTAFGSLKIFTQGFKALGTAQQLSGLGKVGGGAVGGFASDVASEALGGAAGGALVGGGLKGLGRAALGRAAGAAALGAKGAALAGSAAAGFGVGEVGGSLALGRDLGGTSTAKALSKLSAAIGVSATEFSALAGVLGPTVARMTGLGKAADELTDARKQLVEAERERAKSTLAGIDRNAQEKLTTSKAQFRAGQFRARNDEAEERERLLAGGDQFKLAGLRGTRLSKQLSTLQRLSGGTGAEAEAAKGLLGGVREQLTATASGSIDLIRNRGAARDRQFEAGQDVLRRQIEGSQQVLETQGKLAPASRDKQAISKAEESIKQAKITLQQNLKLELQRDQADDDLIAKMADIVEANTRARTADLEAKLRDELDRRNAGISNERQEQIVQHRSQFR